MKKKEFCALCYYKGPGALHYHHIDRNRKNNSPDNILVLCPNCHNETHRKLRTNGNYVDQEKLENISEKAKPQTTGTPILELTMKEINAFPDRLVRLAALKMIDNGTARLVKDNGVTV